MASIEDILAYKAQQDFEKAETIGNIAGIGGMIGGSALGYDIGNLGHQTGKRLNTMLGKQPGALNRIKPGARMAGSLVGAITGGLLGKEITRQAIDSEAGMLLAKIQSGQATEADGAQLQRLIYEAQKTAGVV